MLVFTQNGLTKNCDKVTETVRPYYRHRKELTYSNEIILKGTTMLVPKTLQIEMELLLYTGRLRTVKLSIAQNKLLCLLASN